MLLHGIDSLSTLNTPNYKVTYIRLFLVVSIMHIATCLVARLPRNGSFFRSSSRAASVLCCTVRSSTSNTQPTKNALVTSLFDLQLPEGRCVGLELGPDVSVTPANASACHWIHSLDLHRQEIEYGFEKASSQQISFWMGRLAMRSMLPHCEPILKDDYGRPLLPSTHLGSISHKNRLAVALLREHEDAVGVGVDIEVIDGARGKTISRRVLTVSEQNELGKLPVRCSCCIVRCRSDFRFPTMVAFL